MLIIILLVSLLFRFIISPLGFHVDIISNAGWGQWIYLHGPMGFYTNNVWTFSWPTQPPFVSLLYGFDQYLYIWLLQLFRSACNTIVAYHLAPGHMIWFFNFTKWFDISKVSVESAFTTGYLVSIKILPILADIFIAFIIFKIAKILKNKTPLFWPTLYLILPFSWYLSALWGQYDQLSYLFVLSAFLLESQKKLGFLTPFIFALSIAVKPTSLILLPFFIFVYIKNNHSKLSYIFSISLIALFFYSTTQIFTKENVITFTSDVLFQKIFFKSGFRLTTNAFNFWRIFVGNKIADQNDLFLFIPARIWSIAAFIFLNFIAMKTQLKKMNLQSIFVGVFIISAGSWLFMTNMLDRYFFAAVATGLIVSIYNRKILKYWIVLSLIFWINLYHGWWFPEFLSPFYHLLSWQEGLITRILSLINVILFLKVVLMLKKEKQLN